MAHSFENTVCFVEGSLPKATRKVCAGADLLEHFCRMEPDLDQAVFTIQKGAGTANDAQRQVDHTMQDCHPLPAAPPFVPVIGMFISACFSESVRALRRLSLLCFSTTKFGILHSYLWQDCGRLGINLLCWELLALHPLCRKLLALHPCIPTWHQQLPIHENL